MLNEGRPKAVRSAAVPRPRLSKFAMRQSRRASPRCLTPKRKTPAAFAAGVVNRCVKLRYCAVTTTLSTATPQSVTVVSLVKRKRIFTLLLPTYGVRLSETCDAHDG
jgi:hypothetical protein